MRRPLTLIENGFFIILVALSVALSGALWLSLPNPDVVKAQTAEVPSPSVAVSPETPLLIGWSSAGHMAGLLPDDPGFGLLWKEIRVALADAKPMPASTAVLDGLKTSPQVLAVELSPDLTFSTIVPWASSLDGEILISGGARPFVVLVSPAGDATAVLAVREAGAIFHALPKTARTVVNAASAATPFLPLPSGHIQIGPMPSFSAPPARTLVNAFFSEPLMVWSIAEAGGVTSYTDGKAVLRRYPTGAFTYTSSASSAFSPADPVGVALAFVAEHPGFPAGLEAFSEEASGTSYGLATTVGLVPQVDGIPILGGAAASLTLYGTRVGEASLVLRPYASGGEVSLSPVETLASLPSAQREQVVEAVPAIDEGAQGPEAGLDLLLASGREMFVVAPKGGGS